MDYEALSRRISNPDRPRLAEARAVVGEVTDPRRAWESLVEAGFVSPAWITNPDRRFCGGEDGASRSKWPTSVSMCLALAADVPGIEAAESFARDFVEALEPWGCRPLTRVAWWYGGEPGQSVPRCSAHAAAQAAAQGTGLHGEWRGWYDEATQIREQVWSGYRAGGSRACLEAGWDAVAAFWWRLAVRRRGIVPPELIPRTRASHKALAGRPLRSLRDPFEPIMGIWQLGYGCGELTDHDIVLVMPKIDGSNPAGEAG